MNIDCTILDDAIQSAYEAHLAASMAEFAETIVSNILTDLVECNYVDDAWGHLIYNADESYNADVDDAVQEQLVQHIESVVNKNLKCID